MVQSPHLRSNSVSDSCDYTEYGSDSDEIYNNIHFRNPIFFNPVELTSVNLYESLLQIV
jgi:hypothetical protein